MAATDIGQTILALVEDDAVLDFGPALITFFTNIQAAAGDPIKLELAWVQLQGNLVQAGPTALGALEGQLAGIILTKIQALMTAAKPS